MSGDFNRREFFQIVSVAGAGLLLGFRLPAKNEVVASEGDEFVPNAYLRISVDGLVTVTVHRSELGQGVQTAIPMIVADELEADWATIRVEQAPADRKYGDQVTGGSMSIQTSYAVLRAAGAVGRMMLVAAAAQTWGVDVAECRAENGAVLHEVSGQKLTYGELTAAAATQPVPKGREIVLKSPAEFRYIGTRKGQIDNPDFVTGKAMYASDLQLPGMLYAVVARCPVFGGKVASFDASEAEAIAGVRQVLQIANGVAVVAENTWAAMKGREALVVTWDEGKNAELSSEGIRTDAVAQIEDLATQNAGGTAEAATVLDALYEVPYLAHTPIEPVLCIADVRADGCDVWVPTQSRQDAKARAQAVSKLKGDTVNVHVPLIGGAFGRRLRVDYVDEAVEISQAVGAPVKVVWTRDDDIQHDFYRPVSFHRLRGGLDADGKPITWEHYSAAQGIGGSSELDQGINIPYNIGKKTVRHAPLTLPIPVGYWRSVFNTQNAYVNECFIDELAAASGQDPYEFRLSLLAENAPIRPVLELVATKAGWGDPLPEGWGRGIACHTTWSTHVAQVAEVSVTEDGEVKVHRVVCAIDCGVPVNLDMIEAQMEGGIVFGLSALYGEITLKDGRVEQSNFNNYRLLRLREMPVIEVYVIPSDRAPVGTGEMGNPPATPAVLNAVFAVTGKRIRRLPLRPEDLTG